MPAQSKENALNVVGRLGTHIMDLRREMRTLPAGKTWQVRRAIVLLEEAQREIMGRGEHS